MFLTRTSSLPGVDFDRSSLETVLLEMTRTVFQLQAQLESVSSLQGADVESFWARERRASITPLSLFVQLLKLFFLETRYRALRRPEQQRDRFVALEEQILDTEEHVRLLTISIDAKTATLPLAFVIGESFEQASTSNLWLYSLQEGLEEHGTASRLIERLTLRLSNPNAQDPFVQALPEDIRDSLAQGQTPRLSLVPASEQLFRLQVDDIRQVQPQAPVQHALQHRVTARLRQHREGRLPEWLRFLEGEERILYSQREQAVGASQQRVDEHLQGIASFEQYAAAQIAGFVAKQLGLEVDAQSLRVRVRHALNIEGEALHGEREMPLMQWVLAGGYHGNMLQAHIIDSELAVYLTPVFIQHMINVLEVRLSYRQALESSYFSEVGRQLMMEVIDARLALSTLAARYQGLDQHAFNTLEAARIYAGKLADLGIEAGAVILEPFKQPLKDLLYLGFGQGTDRRFILYAPGAPGADLRVFKSSAQLNREIALWSSNEVGQAYLLAQVPVVERTQLGQWLRQVQRLSNHWAERAIALAPWPEVAWRDVLSAMARLRVNAVLDQLQLATPQWYADASLFRRQALTNLDAELVVAQQVYLDLSPVESFADYAHRLVAGKLNELLGKEAAYVDPDSVLVELEKGNVRTLTRTVIGGYDSSFNFADFATISSTIGQDLSRLDRRSVDGYIRSARLGEHYIRMIRDRLLDRRDPLYERRRLLHRHVLILQIRRAWLSDSMAGGLTPAQSQWLGSALDGLLDLEPEVVGGDRTSRKNGVFQLALNGRRVEGVYVFRHVLGEAVEDLLYTPQAPDGQFFHTPQALAEKWHDTVLQDYFYLRVSIADQPAIGSLIDRFQRAGDGRKIILEAIGDYGRVTNLANEFDAMVQRIIADVDEDTTSVAERISGLLFDVATGLVVILTIPFPPASLALSVVLTLRSFTQGVIAYLDGDRAAATKFFLVAGVGFVSVSGIGGRLVRLLSRLSKGPSSPSVELIKQLSSDLQPVASKSLSSLSKAFEGELKQFLELFERHSMPLI